MEQYIKCRHENGFFIFDTLERYPEDIANDILDVFIAQNLEAISYKIADHHWFQVTGRIRENFVRLTTEQTDGDPVMAKMNSLKNNLEYKVKELIRSNPE